MINSRGSKILPIVILIFSCLFFGSCITNKKIQYLQEIDSKTNYADTIKFNRSQYRLQVNDIINIEIKTRNTEFAALFGNNNLAGAGNIGNVAGGGGGDLFYTVGYTISDSGSINFPFLGKVDIAGLTITEVSEKLEKELRVFQVDALAIVRLGGLRFTLLGEFNRPGKYVILQNQVSIFEALATGGDLKEIARRDRVTLVRQYPDGVRIHYINVLDKNLINSPYYFLQPNDLLYVEPLKRRAYGIGVNGLQTLTTALSVISTALLLINYFNR